MPKLSNTERGRLAATARFATDPAERADAAKRLAVHHAAEERAAARRRADDGTPEADAGRTEAERRHPTNPDDTQEA